MPIIRWKPFSELDDLFEHFHRHKAMDLALDLYDEDDSIIVEMTVAGIDPDKIDISAEDNSLRIVGNREEKEEIEDRNYYRKEIKRGEFERLIPLPSSIDPEKTRAEVDHGILRIYLSKKKASHASKIKIEKK
jgi:HSP20 family protein